MTAKNVEDAVRAIRDGDKVEMLRLLSNGVDSNDRNRLGWTLLHIACLEGKSEIADILLDKGASVNCCTTDMSTPLHRAAGHGNIASIEVLVKKGAYINAQDKNGNTPLHEAAKHMHTNVIKFLIDKKADKSRLNNKKQKFTDMVGQQLMPIVESGDVDTLHQWLDWKLSPSTFGNLNWSVLHHASARGQINIASLLLEKGANVNAPDSNKSSALHAACFHGNKRIVELLIGKGANVNAKDQLGNTPLHSAIRGAHPDIINILLESGCDTKIPNSEGQIFTHLVNEFLIEAVENKRVAHVSSLLKGQANPDTKDSAGCPVLCVATFKGELLIVDALLAAGANPNLPSENNIKTPLHYASIWGHFFILKSLLDKGASVTTRDLMNKIPLHEAARGGFEDMVTVLVGRCSPMDAQDTDGNTSLHLAARWGHTSIVDLLLEKGANDSTKNYDCHTYLDLALMRAVRTEDKDQVMACLAWGGDPNTLDSKGWCLLHHAAYKGALDVCRLLIESEAEVNIIDKEERTPLLLAAYRGNLEITQELIDAGADMNMKDKQHHTPLHWAAAEGSIATVEILLQRGANRQIRNKEGMLYTDLLLKHLYFAVRHNDLDKVQCLLRAGADQTAIVRGTGTTPRDEAKRRKNFSILRQMLSLAPKKKSQVDAMAVEFISYLFEESDSSSEDETSSSGQSSDEDSDQDAYWKMHNAHVIIKEKDLLEEEAKLFWENWDEKPTVISVKDWCKDDIDEFWKYWEEKSQIISAKDNFKDGVLWWQKESESESETDESESIERERYLVISFEESKKKWGEVISAKEFFKEDECWWRDAVKELYSSDEETENGHTFLTMADVKRKWGAPVPAKEFFREDECWWRDAVEELDSSSDEESAITEVTIPTISEIKRTWENIILAEDVFNDTDKDWLNSCGETNVSTKKSESQHIINGELTTDTDATLADDDSNIWTDYNDCRSFNKSWNKDNESFPGNSTMFSIRDGKIFATEWVTTSDENTSEENNSICEHISDTIESSSDEVDSNSVGSNSSDTESISIRPSLIEDDSKETASSSEENDSDSIESSSSADDSSSIESSSCADDSESSSCADDSESMESSSVESNSASIETSSIEENINYIFERNNTNEKHFDSDKIDINLINVNVPQQSNPNYSCKEKISYKFDDDISDGSIIEIKSEDEADDIEEDGNLETQKYILNSTTNIKTDILNEGLLNKSPGDNKNSHGAQISLEPLWDRKSSAEVSEFNENNFVPKGDSLSDNILESSFTLYIKPVKCCFDINPKSHSVHSSISDKNKHSENSSQHYFSIKADNNESLESEESSTNAKLSKNSYTFNSGDTKNDRILSENINLEVNKKVEAIPIPMLQSTEMRCVSKIVKPSIGWHISEVRDPEKMTIENEENFHVTTSDNIPFRTKVDNSVRFLSQTNPSEPELMVSDNVQLILDSKLIDCYDGINTRISHANVDTNIAFETQQEKRYPEKSDRVSISSNNSAETNAIKQQKNVVSEMDECLAKVSVSLNLLKRRLSTDHPIPQLNSTLIDSKAVTQIQNPKIADATCVNHPYERPCDSTTDRQSIEFSKIHVTVPNHHVSRNSMDKVKDNLSTCFNRTLTTREIGKPTTNISDSESQEMALNIKVISNGEHQLPIYPDEKIQSMQVKHDLNLLSSVDEILSNEDTFKVNLDNASDSYTHPQKCRYDGHLDRTKDSSCKCSTPLTIYNDSLIDASSNTVCKHINDQINHEINQVTFCNTGMSTSCAVENNQETKPLVDMVSACFQDDDKIRVSKQNEPTSITIFIVESVVYLLVLIYTIISGLISMVSTDKAS